jgi:tetratricopeptide (TPR) repeat protein
VGWLAIVLFLAPAAGSSADAPDAERPDAELRDTVGRADQAFKAGRWPEARSLYEGLLARRSGPSKTLHEQIARCDSHAGDHAAALDRLLPLLAANPEDGELRLWVAREEIQAGRVPSALARLATVDPATVTEPSVYFDVAALLLNQSRPADAIPFLTRAIALDPAFLDGYFQRGLAYVHLGRTAEAERDLRKVVELAPQSPQAETARKGLRHLR